MEGVRSQRLDFLDLKSIVEQRSILVEFKILSIRCLKSAGVLEYPRIGRTYLLRNSNEILRSCRVYDKIADSLEGWPSCQHLVQEIALSFNLDWPNSIAAVYLLKAMTKVANPSRLMPGEQARCLQCSVPCQWCVLGYRCTICVVEDFEAFILCQLRCDTSKDCVRLQRCCFMFLRCFVLL